MKLELQSACNFIVHLIRIKKQNICEPQLKCFYNNLLDVFIKRFCYHWFPNKPYKGSGYRCIRFNDVHVDPMIIQAGAASKLSSEFLKETLPNNLILWIDPQDVSYRIGEHGCIYSLFDHTCTEAWKPIQHVKQNQVVPIKHVKPNPPLTCNNKEMLSANDYLSNLRTISIEDLKSYMLS